MDTREAMLIRIVETDVNETKARNFGQRMYAIAREVETTARMLQSNTEKRALDLFPLGDRCGPYLVEHGGKRYTALKPAGRSSWVVELCEEVEADAENPIPA